MYELQIEQGAERDLKNLKKTSHEEFQRVASRISALRDTPRPVGSRKIIGSKNDWRLRIGTYRVIYEIDDRQQVIKIFRVKHRREVYR